MGHEVLMKSTTTVRVGIADVSNASSILEADMTSCAWDRANHGCSMVKLFSLSCEMRGYLGDVWEGETWMKLSMTAD
jgi:hypothetical protein